MHRLLASSPLLMNHRYAYPTGLLAPLLRVYCFATPALFSATSSGVRHCGEGELQEVFGRVYSTVGTYHGASCRSPAVSMARDPLDRVSVSACHGGDIVPFPLGPSSTASSDGYDHQRGDCRNRTVFTPCPESPAVDRDCPGGGREAANVSSVDPSEGVNLDDFHGTGRGRQVRPRSHIEPTAFRVSYSNTTI